MPMSQEAGPPVQTAGTVSGDEGFGVSLPPSSRVPLTKSGLKNLIIFIILGMGLSQLQRERLVLVVGALFSCLLSSSPWPAVISPTATANAR